MPIAERNIKCKNCLSTRFKLKAKGLCSRCYSLTRKFKIVEQWNLENIETLKYYPKDMIFHNQRDFNKIKNGFIRQLEDRLSYLQSNEEMLGGAVNGVDIVPRFQKVSELAGSRNKDFLWHEEDLFDQNFTSKQKKILFSILNQIIESIPWRGIDWNKIFR
ncbi:MAG: hypothetical protein WC582_05510 [Patescibacteria group bacterium]